MSEQHRITITDAEVLAVCGGADDATGQPVVVLTLRPITGSGWRFVIVRAGDAFVAVVMEQVKA